MTDISRRSLLAAALAAPLMALLPGHGFAASPKVYTADGAALGGTDVVAYFTDGAAVAGDAGITHDWNGATWRFATEANRAAFAADPEAYAPQYGGYCAYAVSEGYTAPTNPEAWRVEDGKLYLNYSKGVQGIWEQDIPGRISSANANWPKVLD